MDICICNIYKAFGTKQVLKDFCAELKEGTCTIVMGPSGCGKTTLLRILMGLDTPDSGRVEGMPDRVSVVFQEDRLCRDFSAIDNVAMVMRRPVSEELIRQHLKRIGLTDSMEQPIQELSGGMKRRVAIVRAVLALGDMLVLDEPFQGLDPATKKAVISYVMEEIKGKTSIIVTHDREEAELIGTQTIRMQLCENSHTL